MFGRNKRHSDPGDFFLGDWEDRQEPTPPAVKETKKEEVKKKTEPLFPQKKGKDKAPITLSSFAKQGKKILHARRTPDKKETESLIKTVSVRTDPDKTKGEKIPEMDASLSALFSYLKGKKEDSGPAEKEEVQTNVTLPQIETVADAAEPVADMAEPVADMAEPTAKDSPSSPTAPAAKKRKATRDVKKEAADPGEVVRSSLDGMYGVSRKEEGQTKKKLGTMEIVRYGILFVCIFGFFSAGYFVFSKLYDYYRSFVIYSGLQEMVAEPDRFADMYLKKALTDTQTLTPEDILAGKVAGGGSQSGTFSQEQETLVQKIGQLKKINPDTTGWISIEGTVVNYPLVWSKTRNYYLHRDFYGKKLSGGAIYMDERNSPDITKNRNTVIYGHNMSDGSMFASVHDFSSASVFYGVTIQIATQEGIFIYKPFSVHESNAFDNYFETDFASDEDFINFCEQMAFISIFETDHSFDKNSQIITLSTCMTNQNTTDGRFAVHAVLVEVIR